MKIAIGSDSSGHNLKDAVAAHLAEAGHEVVDVGWDGAGEPEYSAHYAKQVAHLIRDGEADRGVLVCGTGIGISIAANKVKGIRAALANNVELARLTREHNDANVIALGGRMQSLEAGYEIVATFLGTEFSGEERHQRRIDQLAEYEAGR